MSYAPPPAYQPPATTPQGEPPLNRPYYGVSFPVAIRRFFSNYANFSGRASRSEFWWWYMLEIIAVIAYNVLTTVLHGSSAQSISVGYVIVVIVFSIWFLGTVVPTLAIIWRRLHDTNRSGAWYFLGFIPIVGTIIVIVWFASASKPEGQRFDR